MPVNESDWKLLRKLLPDWQRRYMERLIAGYIELLQSDTPSEDRFWELEERLRRDVRKTGVCCEMRRSLMHQNLANLLLEKAISIEELSVLSEQTQERVRFWAGLDEDVA